MEEEFKNKSVVVTGGTDGMGLATAKLFAELGARVFISGRNAQKGAAAAAEIGRSGGRAEYVRCDISNPADAKGLMEHVVRQAGSVDVAFNNAGITSKAHSVLAQFDETEWANIVNVNLNGMFYCMKYEILAMLSVGRGVITNNSSIAGLVSMPMQAAYAASKAGVIALTESAAIDYAQQGIRINAIAPGPVMGGMNSEERLKANPERTAKKFSLTAMNRFAEPLEIAEAVVWISSSKASFITGATLPIDGGFSAGKW